jgi:FAD/FMN-containing dehydrogenase
MEDLVTGLRHGLKGEIDVSLKTRQRFSRDASVFEMLPDAVYAPQTSEDIRRLVAYTMTNKHLHPGLSITPRGGGTDMTGGAINSSIILDMTPHFTEFKTVNNTELQVQPGAAARDIETFLAKQGRMLGSMPASRAWCTIGGMVANNAGGEQSLRYGNTQHAIKELNVILADAHEYIIKPLTKRQLDAKMAKTTFEGAVYAGLFELIEDNYDLIRNARPKTRKLSMGYNLWDVWDRDTGIFDLTQLFAGSQGTLGIITDITLKTEPKAPHTGVLVLYLNSQKHLGHIIETVSAHKPAVFEGFDDLTFELGIKHFDVFKKQLGSAQWLKQQASLLASIARFKGHIPRMTLLVEFDGASLGEVAAKISALQNDLKIYNLKSEVAGSEKESGRFWQIRRASFRLLSEHIHDKYAAPFIDDLVVPPKHLPEFLPKLRRILRSHNLPITIAGHFGDGNLHMLPLVDMKSERERLKLEQVMRDTIPLILEYDGALAGEHNDGMIRGPWLPAVFGDEMFQLFRDTKELFDPLYIFNPHKKTDASWATGMKYFRK